VTVTVYVPGFDPTAIVNPEATNVPALIVQVGEPIMFEELLVIVHDVSAGDVLNPDPFTWTVVSTGPVLGARVIAGVAFTFWMNAVSAETNSAMRRISNVTAYRVRRNASKSKHTSLKLFD